MLALSIVLTSQGISFLHAGTEFLRSKKGVENSFNAGDSINAINWFDKADNSDVFQFVRGLIAMRRDHPAFRMVTAEQIASHITFEQVGEGLVSFTINGESVGDEWKKVRVIYNSRTEPVKIALQSGSWQIFAHGNALVTPDFGFSKVQETISVSPLSATILFRN